MTMVNVVSGNQPEPRPWLRDYETLDYRRVWKGKRLEDFAQKQIVEDWLPYGDRCLELGGGFGRITRVLEPKFREVVSLEYSARNVGIAKATLRKAQLARADIVAIPSQDSVYDCVVMIRVIHLLPNPRQVMNEILRVAKDGATVILSMPNLPINNMMWEIKRVFGKDEERGPFVWPYDCRRIFVPPAHFLPKGFSILGRRGTGMFDNPLGSALEPIQQLYLLDVATSRFWFTKADIFLKLRISK